MVVSSPGGIAGRALATACWLVLLVGPTAAAMPDTWVILGPRITPGLEGWSGDRARWSVEADGVLVGRTTPDDPLDTSSWLIWDDGLPEDFVLTFEVSIPAGNSGVQLRSRRGGPLGLLGPQLDLDAAHQLTGSLYDLERGVLAGQGQRAAPGDDGALVVEDMAARVDILDLLRGGLSDRWRQVRVAASGDVIETHVDGVLVSRVEDPDGERGTLVALQLHPGAPMEVRFRNFAGRATLDRLQPAAPRWIWTGEDAVADEVVVFRRQVEVDPLLDDLELAFLTATGDNSVEVRIDGELVLSGDDWAEPRIVDLAERLRSRWPPPAFTLEARVWNEGGPAGLCLELALFGSFDSSQRVVSDESWSWTRPAGGLELAPVDEPRPAVVVAPLGEGPWGSDVAGAFRRPPWGEPQPDPAAIPSDLSHIELAEGFAIEQLHVTSAAQGSWVSLCVDPRGRLLTSDQHGGGLWRITLPDAPGDAPLVERIDLPLSAAQGLAFVGADLYVLVAHGGVAERGLHRVRDTDGDDVLDEVTLLTALESNGGEHGWHSLVPDPAGDALIVVAGNGTTMPPVSASRVPPVWGEDQLLPRLPDANGFMTTDLAPGGCLYRVSLDGRHWELLSSGYRNPFDAAFGPDGELFTYDADMEYDLATPWYRPTRVCLVASGSEWGWRNGSGKWPVHWEDGSVPTLDVGPGSPVGVTFGSQAFPPPWDAALFLADWSYGRILAAHLTPDGAGWSGTLEPFLTGRPFAVTDLVVHPDGALYVVTGGRSIHGGLYRITATGEAAPSSAEPVDGGGEAGAIMRSRAAALRGMRRLLESFHGRSDPAAVDTVWPWLGHTDRTLRFAARTALEWQPVDGWRERALDERDPATALAAWMALARVTARDAPHREGQLAGGADALLPHAGRADQATAQVTRDALIDALLDLDPGRLDPHQRLTWLRTLSLVATRLGLPDPTGGDDDPGQRHARLVARLAPRFPADDERETTDLARLLVALQWDGLAAVAVPELSRLATQESQLRLADALTHLEAGWSDAARLEFLAWFDRAQGYAGGQSFAGFVRAVEAQALAALDELPEERRQALLAARGERPAPASPLAALGQAFAGRETREWTVDALLPHLERDTPRDVERGRQLFGAAGCFACHRVAGAGGVVGPDLTGAGGRFSPRDLLEALVDPDAVISDLYRRTLFVLDDGRVLTGQIANLSGGNVMLRTDMTRPGALTTIASRDIVETRESTVSAMPAGLLAPLTADEVADLAAFLLQHD